jgi:uncharacterized membrane protein YdjX (TVP38/TMEM64 family)
VLRWTLALAACAIAVLLTALWLRWPETSRPTAAQWLATAEAWRDAPIAPFVALVSFIVGALIIFPVHLLIAATIVVFGPVVGALYALAGVLLGATTVHEIGRAVPAQTAMRWLGARGERLLRRIVGHGILAVALVRLVPVAPYSIVGFLTGVARVRRRDHFIGTALGMSPGIVLYAVFIDRARAALLAPHPMQWMLLLGAALLLAASALVLRAWHKRRDASS